VYMYACPPGGSFAACDGSGKGWFKIQHAGLEKGQLKGEGWAVGDIARTKKWSTKIPASLAPGDYLIRHELLALHSANNPQFYPECAQLRVTGSGSKRPGGKFLVSIPGYARQGDPGVTVSVLSGGGRADWGRSMCGRARRAAMSFLGPRFGRARWNRGLPAFSRRN
jgi:hypothetical protein